MIELILPANQLAVSALALTIADGLGRQSMLIQILLGLCEVHARFALIG